MLLVAHVVVRQVLHDQVAYVVRMHYSWPFSALGWLGAVLGTGAFGASELGCSGDCGAKRASAPWRPQTREIIVST